jgi:hypothetical protein
MREYYFRAFNEKVDVASDPDEVIIDFRESRVVF